MKEWMKQYGIHIAICVLVAGVAFGFNRKIDIDRSYIYTVSEGVTTLLKDVDLKAEETGKLTFTGWGFDTNYYDENSACELILQDTETGEAFWPKMERKPEPVEIPDRYTDGGDYSAASFAGSIREDKLKEDSVYEILLRYSCEYSDENGNKQKYVKTVATDEFLYQGELTEYNPKTFVAPEIAGTELEKELSGARLFHYFPEGVWVYYTAENLYYILDKSILKESEEISFPILWSVRNIEDLPENRREYGFGNNGFYWYENEVFDSGIINYRIWRTQIPSEKIIYMHTGIYSYTESKWIVGIRKQIGDVFDE